MRGRTRRNAAIGAWIARSLALATAALVVGCASDGERGPEVDSVAEAGEAATVSLDASLQETIDEASAGSTLRLPPGSSWDVNLEISESLTLRGDEANPPRISGNVQSRPVISIEGRDEIVVRIENVIVREAGGGASDCVSVRPLADRTICADGLAVSGDARVQLVNVTIEENGRMGICATDASRVSLEGCEVTGSGRIGLFVQRSAECDATDSRFVGNNEGVMIADSAKVRLQSCIVADNGSYGLYVGGEAACTLSECEVSGNGQHGVAVAAESTVDVLESRIVGNQGAGIIELNYPSSFAGTVNVDDASAVDGNEVSDVGSE